MNAPTSTITAQPEPTDSNRKVHLLADARLMPFVTLKNLSPVVQALIPLGAIVVACYDERQQRLTFYSREVLMPYGRAGEHTRGADDASAPLAALRTAPEGASVRPAGMYEDEASERRSYGSISLTPDTLWSATLSVPITGGGGIVFLQLERNGSRPADYRGDREANFSLPDNEVDTVLMLLSGIVAQARRDGVLSDPTSDEPTGAETTRSPDS